MDGCKAVSYQCKQLLFRSRRSNAVAAIELDNGFAQVCPPVPSTASATACRRCRARAAVASAGLPAATSAAGAACMAAWPAAAAACAAAPHVSLRVGEAKNSLHTTLGLAASWIHQGSLAAACCCAAALPLTAPLLPPLPPQLGALLSSDSSGRCSPLQRCCSGSKTSSCGSAAVALGCALPCCACCACCPCCGCALSCCPCCACCGCSTSTIRPACTAAAVKGGKRVRATAHLTHSWPQLLRIPHARHMVAWTHTAAPGQPVC